MIERFDVVVVGGGPNVLSGGNRVSSPLRLRVALRILYTLARFNGWLRRRAGLPMESRLEW